MRGENTLNMNFSETSAACTHRDVEDECGDSAHGEEGASRHGRYVGEQEHRGAGYYCPGSARKQHHRDRGHRQLMVDLRMAQKISIFLIFFLNFKLYIFVVIF